MSTATLQNLDIRQGTSWVFRFTWLDSDSNPVNLTGCTAAAQLRKAVGTDILAHLTTANSFIELGGALGIITLKLDPATTAGLSVESGVYDLKIVLPDGSVEVPIYGSFKVTMAVTV